MRKTERPNFLKNPALRDPPVQGFQLLRGGNIVPGLAVSSPLTLT